MRQGRHEYDCVAYRGGAQRRHRSEKKESRLANADLPTGQRAAAR